MHTISTHISVTISTHISDIHSVMPHADQEGVRFTVNLARQYLHSEKVKAVGDRKDAWIFDIHETTLSNLGYYEQIEFGGAPYNHTKYFCVVYGGKGNRM